MENSWLKMSGKLTRCLQLPDEVESVCGLGLMAMED